MLFQCVNGQAVEAAVQRVVGVSVVGDTERLSGHGHGHPAGGDPACVELDDPLRYLVHQMIVFAVNLLAVIA